VVSDFFGFSEAAAGGLRGRDAGARGEAFRRSFILLGLFDLGGGFIVAVGAVEALFEFDDGFAEIFADFRETASEDEEADDENDDAVDTEEAAEVGERQEREKHR
jgi:hypothetical protein